MKMNDKCVVVTGGSRGIGLAVVESLLGIGKWKTPWTSPPSPCPRPPAGEGAGGFVAGDSSTDRYRVVCCSREPSDAITQLISQYPQSCLWVQCEIGDEDSEKQFMQAALEWIGDGYLWGLVNNAGTALAGVLATFPDVDTERIVQVNLLGAIRLSRLALRKMIAQKDGGRIVNVSSIVGLRGFTGTAAYAASKAGLDGVTRALAREVGRRGITVNSVAPGYIATELSRSLTEEQREQIVRRTPLGELARPDDVADCVRFLLSNSARCITGQTIVVDGGLSC